MPGPVIDGVVSKDDFFCAMRQVAASVSVVTTDGIAGRHGATVSAFSSLTADPPTVLVCLKSDSRIARLVRQNGAYCVNVLPEDADQIASRFAGLQDDELEDRFEGLTVSKATDAMPEIERATSFHCQVVNIFRQGSHDIVTGQVVKIKPGDSRPLTYMDGQYHYVRPQQQRENKCQSSE